MRAVGFFFLWVSGDWFFFFWLLSGLLFSFLPLLVYDSYLLRVVDSYIQLAFFSVGDSTHIFLFFGLLF